MGVSLDQQQRDIEWSLQKCWNGNHKQLWAGYRESNKSLLCVPSNSSAANMSGTHYYVSNKTPQSSRLFGIWEIIFIVFEADKYHKLSTYTLP